MMSPRHRHRAALAVLLGITSIGCRDSNGIVQTAGQATLRSITPGTSVAIKGDNAVITVVLDVRGNVGKIGSFTGRLRFDPAALVYEGAVELTDGTMRAWNPGVDEIRVAGASSAGVDLAQLAAFRFTVKNAKALQDVRFDLDEVHELSRGDLRAVTQRSAAPRLLQ